MTQKTLKDFLEVYKPKSPDEQKFVDKHVVIKHKDRNGNSDDVFNATKIKTNKRKDDGHGYDVGDDEKVYEEAESIEEGYKIGDLVNVTNPKATPRYKIVGKTKTHYHIEKPNGDRMHMPKERIARVNKQAWSIRKAKVNEEAYGMWKVDFPKQHAGKDVAAGSVHVKAQNTAHAHKVAAKRVGVDSRMFKSNVTKSSTLPEEVGDLLGEALDLLNSIDEKTLTPAEMKKREEVVKAIKRGDPKMDKSMAYAIATKTAKRVAEDTEDLDESAKIAAHLIKRYGDNVRKSHVVSAANDFGVDASKLAKTVRTKLGKTTLAEEEDDGWYTHSQMHGSKKSEKHPKGISAAEWKSGIRWHHGKNKRINIKEELEELDELSDKYLANYKAAATDARRHRGLTTKKLDDRYLAVIRAGDKMNKGFSKVHATEDFEEAESIDEGGMPSSVIKHKQKLASMSNDELKAHLAGKSEDHLRQMAWRHGYGKMSDHYVKIVKEETLDELSNKAYGRYINKAAERIGTGGITTGLKIANNEPSKNNIKKMDNRQKGIATAVKKLTKEDIINRVIDKYVPEEIKFTPEDRFLKRLQGLSEVHVSTLLGLFEQLNKDNQQKMIDTVSTEDGINSVLNFVLDSRGE